MRRLITSHLQPGSGEKWMLVLTSHLSFYSTHALVLEMMLPRGEEGLPSSANLVWITLTGMHGGLSPR